MSDISARLRDVAAAYPEDIFPPFTDEERKANSMVISRASGNMGRFLSRHMTEAADTIDTLVAVLEHAQTILSNMAQENPSAYFQRWPIHHEPLRSDAKNLLPILDAALAKAKGGQTDG